MYPALLVGFAGSDKASGADNQQGRPASEREPSETARQTGLVKRAWKIQSELHGDMQSQAEMTWPPSRKCARV